MKGGRFEYKYLVPERKVSVLREALMPYVAEDPYQTDGDTGEYTVRSVYFDTNDFEAYREKLEGINSRKKFRIRGYNRPTLTSLVFLEIKRKDGSVVSKNRAPLLHSDCHSALHSANPEQYVQPVNGNGNGADDAKKFLFHYYSKSLKPVVLIVYEREAYFGSTDRTLRITIDKNIRSRMNPSLDTLYSDEGLVPALAGYAVLEVKFSSGIPGWMRAINAGLNLKRMSISKYMICIDSHGGIGKVSIYSSWRGEWDAFGRQTSAM